MTISRRAFLASASAFSIMEGLASAAGDKRIFAPNGGQAADFLICRRLYLDICGRIPTPEEVTEYVSSDVDEGWATVIVYVICIALYIPLVVRAAHTLRDIDVPNRGAFFRERAGVVAAPAAPAAPVAAPAAAYAASTQQGYPAQYVQPQQYVQQPQQYVQPQPYAQQPYAQQPPVPQQPAVPPANPIPTQIPDENLFQTDRSDPRNIGQ